MICVEIEVDDKGAISVGVVPKQENEGAQGTQGEQPGNENYMQPAQSVDEALAKAKELLSGQGSAQPDQAQAEAQFKQGFAGPTAGGYG